jgi:hypothetical protein
LKEEEACERWRPNDESTSPRNQLSMPLLMWVSWQRKRKVRQVRV